MDIWLPPPPLILSTWLLNDPYGEPLPKVLSRVITDNSKNSNIMSIGNHMTFWKVHVRKAGKTSIVGAAGSAKFRFICTFQEKNWHPLMGIGRMTAVSRLIRPSSSFVRLVDVKTWDELLSYSASVCRPHGAQRVFDLSNLSAKFEFIWIF